MFLCLVFYIFYILFVFNSIVHLSNHFSNMSCILYIFSYIYLLATFAAIGGFLFGYDTGVISGAMIPLKRHFNLSVELQEVVVSVTIGGAIIGSFTSAFFNGKFGRRVVLILASVVFTIGSALLAGATSVVVLILGRLTVGIAIGSCFFKKSYQTNENIVKVPTCKICSWLIIKAMV